MNVPANPSGPSPNPELSIVIPAYDEQARLPKSLCRIQAYVQARRTASEVIVVDDGSTDGTAAIVEKLGRDFPGLRLVSNGRNRGKGFSVRHGVLQARGRIVLFTDADLSAPIEEADKLLAALREYDIAIGSRAIDRSLIEVHQSSFREMAGVLFNRVVQAVTGLSFQDTQCGFKAFLRERSLIVFEQQQANRFGFDPELLFLAKRHGLRVLEIPVRWAHDPATRVHLLRDSLHMLGELGSIRWNWLLGRYPKSQR